MELRKAMYTIGLDIGTTTICGVAADAASGAVVMTRSRRHSFAPAAQPYAKVQDAQEIVRMTDEILQELLDACPQVCGIGLTGQMHGIVYTDREGNALSPLITWQDGRGNLCAPGGQRTYAQQLSEVTGDFCASGYGAVTLYTDLQMGNVPRGAARIVTIPDYYRMHLCCEAAAVTHPSLAASMGLFDAAAEKFDQEKAACAKIPCEMLPDVREAYISHTRSGIPVFGALGDNQASFLGSVREPDKSILVNIGTGSQLTLAIDAPAATENCETRPYLSGRFLAVGSSLCGGRSYALLEKLFREAATMAGAPDPADLYEAMNARALACAGENLTVCTEFCGRRRAPLERGSITGISESNFDVAHLAVGFLSGCIEELYGYYRELSPLAGERSILVGSGNGIRKNPVMRRLLTQRFKMPLCLPLYEEEAAYGSALYAISRAEGGREVSGLIRFEEQKGI